MHVTRALLVHQYSKNSRLSMVVPRLSLGSDKWKTSLVHVRFQCTLTAKTADCPCVFFDCALELLCRVRCAVLSLVEVQAKVTRTPSFATSGKLTWHTCAYSANHIATTADVPWFLFDCRLELLTCWLEFRPRSQGLQGDKWKANLAHVSF